MAFLSVKEGYTGVEAGGSGRGRSLKRTTTRVFTVVTDDPAQGPVWTFPVTVGSTTIPNIGTPHPDNASLFSGVPAVTKKGPTYFEVKVPYESPDPNNNEQNYDDPLEVPTEYSWDDAERAVAYDMDLDGNPVVNTSGQPFDPPTREVSDIVLIIERNQAAFDPDDKTLYQDTICSTTFYGAPAGIVKMGKIKARTVYGQATPYWRVRFEIFFRTNIPGDVPLAKVWWRAMLNQGTIYVGTDGNKYPTPDGKPVCLAADGSMTTPENPHWLYFRENYDKDWTPLALE